MLSLKPVFWLVTFWYGSGPGISFIYLMCTVPEAKFLVLDWGVIVDFGIAGRNGLPAM